MTAADYAAFGGDWEVIGFEYAESAACPCAVCGNGIAQRYSITKPGSGIKVVGSECVKQVTKKSGVLLVKGVESVASSAQREWERPHRIQQLQSASARWLATVDAEAFDPAYIHTVEWRIYHDCNPDLILKDMRRTAPVWEFAWRKWTTDEVETRRLYIGQAVDSWLKAQKH